MACTVSADKDIYESIINQDGGKIMPGHVERWQSRIVFSCEGGLVQGPRLDPVLQKGKAAAAEEMADMREVVHVD